MRETICFSQTSVLWREDDILDFCREIRGDNLREITSCSLLMPFDGNGSNEWRWIPIKELWGRRASSSGYTYPVYVAMDGGTIGEKANTELDTPAEGAELLYCFTNAHRAPGT